MKAPRSLRGQLTLGFTAVATVAIVAVAIGMGLLVRHAVWATLDPVLLEEAETLATVRTIGAHEELPEAVAEVASEPDSGGPKFIRVLDAGGTVIAHAGTVPAAVPALPPPTATHYLTVDGPIPHRIIRYKLSDGGWCEIGVRVQSRLRMLSGAYAAIALSATGLLVALAVLAWTITTRATAEIHRLAAELETIEAGSLDRRVTAHRTTEVERLANVVNRMLGRLETAMEHLRRFTAEAAHELRTPIAALRAHLEVSLQRARSAGTGSDSGAAGVARDGLLDALEQTERLSRLAEDLLTLSAVEAGSRTREPETVSLDAIAREVAEFLEPVAQEQGRRFAWQAEPTVAVRGAPDLLKRVVLNLVDNAFRHTPNTAAVQLTVASENGRACIEVHDDGPGIRPDDLPHVFERFRRGSAVRSGTGLGLALCREIVVRHGGDIVLRSGPAGGTTVRVTLPRVDAAG